MRHQIGVLPVPESDLVYECKCTEQGIDLGTQLDASMQDQDLPPSVAANTCTQEPADAIMSSILLFCLGLLQEQKRHRMY